MAKVYLVAAEPSGDLLASEIAIALKTASPDLELAGIGGEALAGQGIVSPIDVTELSVVGLLEGLKIYKRVLKLADLAADDIVREGPEVVALVDSWGFTLRVAQRVRERAPDIKLVKVVGPQVWATRPGRAKTLAETVDHLVCIHAMEEPFYAPHGLPVTVMGNPALSRGQKGNRQAGREALGVAADASVLLVLPGSRRSEIENVAPGLLDAAQRIKQARPETEVICHPSGNIRAYFAAQFPDLDSWARTSPVEADRYDVMASADYGLACSGTVTSELAMQGVPFLAGYHMGWVTWALARFFLFKPTHITLLNIAAGDTEVVPEFVQTKFIPEAMAATALEMLTDPDARSRQVAAQEKALSLMGEGNLHSARIAADVILAQV